MEKSENLRTFLRENDLFKVPLSDLDIRRFPYRNLAAFFVFMGNPKIKPFMLLSWHALRP